MLRSWTKRSRLCWPVIALGDRVTALIGYDERLLEAARADGLAVERPSP